VKIALGIKENKKEREKRENLPLFFFPLDPLPWPLRPATRSNGQLRQ
jgi:hypothetical protein